MTLQKRKKRITKFLPNIIKTVFLCDTETCSAQENGFFISQIEVIFALL